MMHPPVIYFDGVCNLCTGAVKFILKRDRQMQFKFASLQGQAGSRMLLQHSLTSSPFKTLVLETGGRIYTKSTAALMIAGHLGGLWPLLYVLMIIPRFIRDAVYDLVSANRYSWFGRKQECWLPDPKWESRFLK